MAAFTVLPMNQELKLAAGEVYQGYIVISNPAEATEDFAYKVTVGPYSVLDAEYTADLVSRSDRSEIVDWTRIEEDEGVLAPNETRRVYFTVTVPERAPAGGQYATINVSSSLLAGKSNGATIRDAYEMSSLLFAEIEGETVRGGEVVGLEMAGFSTVPKVEAKLTLTNSGNVHEAAKVETKVRNVLTGEAVTGEVYAEMIMPETTRVLAREIGGMSGLGVYEVTQAVSYRGSEADFVNTVVVCPLWFLALMVLVFATFCWTIVKIVRRNRGKKVDEGFEA